MPNKKEQDLFDKKAHKDNLQTIGMINKLFDTVQNNIYGTSQDNKLSIIDDQFNNIMRNEISTAVDQGTNSVTELLQELWKNENNSSQSFERDIEQMINGTDGEIESYLSDQYKNRLIKQNDIHEVTSHLSELREAIAVTRDAIVTADTADGKISRQIVFNDRASEADSNGLIDAVESMENNYNLHNLIKNHIIPKTLEYGEYYAYVIPYGDIFKQFYDNKEGMMSNSDQPFTGYPSSMVNKGTVNESVEYHEETLFESCDANDIKDITDKLIKVYPPSNNIQKSVYTKEVSEDISNILKNISVNNKPLPICVLSEGEDSIREFCESVGYMTEADKISYDTLFKNVTHQVDGKGVMSADSTYKKRKKNTSFAEYNECYMKLIDPTKLIPVKIMDSVIGYYYIQDQDVTPLTGVLTSTVYYTRYDDSRKEKTLIESIAEQIVRSFNKKFLQKNQQFKDLIVNALSYYRLHEKKLKFQYIPKEYIVEFKVNEDLEGNGTSMIEPALFYAKLYLMLLLFKTLTILKDSNDTRINYIKQSGIDKNYTNKINEIARKRQARTINMTDLMCYTSMISKVGAGHEIYVPVGRSGERGIETEVIQGQDVQLNTELMESLKKQMMTATGVPEVLMNYINEADFAKTLELANTRFQGRVVNYQLDFNKSLTIFYKKLMKGCINIDETVIDACHYKLNPPKSSESQITNDMIQNSNTLIDWLVQLYYGQNFDSTPDKALSVDKFKKRVARDIMTMVNFDKIDEQFKESNLEAGSELHNPVKSNDENGGY